MIPDADNLAFRVARIERRLSDANLFRKPGEAVTDGSWSADNTGRNWTVDFEYRCGCRKVHPGSQIIPAHSRDGGFFNIIGPCGKSNSIQIWRKTPVQNVAQND